VIKEIEKSAHARASVDENIWSVKLAKK